MLADSGCKNAQKVWFNWIKSDGEIGVAHQRELWQNMLEMPVAPCESLSAMLASGEVDRIPIGIPLENRVDILFQRALNGDHFAYEALYDLYTKGHGLVIPEERRLEELFVLDPKKTEERMCLSMLHGRTLFGGSIFLSLNDVEGLLETLDTKYPLNEELPGFYLDPGLNFSEEMRVNKLLGLAKRGNKIALRVLVEYIKINPAIRHVPNLSRKLATVTRISLIRLAKNNDWHLSHMHAGAFLHRLREGVLILRKLGS